MWQMANARLGFPKPLKHSLCGVTCDGSSQIAFHIFSTPPPSNSSSRPVQPNNSLLPTSVRLASRSRPRCMLAFLPTSNAPDHSAAGSWTSSGLSASPDTSNQHNQNGVFRRRERRLDGVLRGAQAHQYLVKYLLPGSSFGAGDRASGRLLLMD